MVFGFPYRRVNHVFVIFTFDHFVAETLVFTASLFFAEAFENLLATIITSVTIALKVFLRSATVILLEPFQLFTLGVVSVKISSVATFVAALHTCSSRHCVSPCYVTS